MSERRWIIDPALGLTLAVCVVAIFSVWIDFTRLETTQRVSEAYAETHEPKEPDGHVDEVCSGLSGTEWSKCALDVVQRHYETSQDARDLNAQEWMAVWAKWMFIAAAAGTIVAGYGLVLLRRTWVEAKRTADIAREVGNDEMRAYVEVAGVDFYWGSANLQSPYFKLLIANHGATPAKWFQIRQRYTIYEHGVSGPPDTFEDLTLPQDFGGRWNGVNPNEKRMTTAGPPITNQRKIQKCHLGTPRVGYNPPDNTHGVVVFGEIRYCTIFDEVFVSQFVFGAGSLLAFKSEEPVEIDRREGGRVTRVVREVTEIPQKLTRLPIALDLYRKERP